MKYRGFRLPRKCAVQMSIDLKLVELTADVLELFFIKCGDLLFLYRNCRGFVYRGSVPCKCRDLWLLYRDCRGFRLPRKRAVRMP